MNTDELMQLVESYAGDLVEERTSETDNQRTLIDNVLASRDALKSALEAMQEQVDSLKKWQDLARVDLANADKERDALQAKLTELQKQEPIYQYMRGDGCWFDQSKTSYDYNRKYGASEVRIVYASPKALEPDMFWNRDDAEKQHGGIGEFLNDEICNGFCEVGSIFTILQGKRLPNVTIKVTAIDEEACEADWEEISDIGIGGQPT